MEKGKLIGKIFGMALAFVLVGAMLPWGAFGNHGEVAASPATIYVPDDYSTIQAAVDIASVDPFPAANLPSASADTDVGTLIAPGVLSSSFPRQLARTSDGVWHCVYYRSDGDYTQIYCSRSTDEGETWTEEQVSTAPLYHYQPSVAIDSDDNVHIAWIVFPDGDPIEQSYGYLWPGYPGHPGRVSTVQYRMKTTAWQSIEDVKTGYHTWLSIAVDSENNVHLVIGGHNPGAWNCEGINYTKRTASGWGPIERVSSGCWTGAAAIAIDESNNVHVVYGHAPYSEPRCEIIYRQRTSSSWGSEIQLQSLDNYASGGISIAIDTNNCIHVVWGWQERGGNNYGIKYRKFTTFWQPTEDIDGPTTYCQRHPMIAIDGNDHLHVVWSGQHSGSPTHFQLRYREYTTSWQPIENLTSSTSDNQTNPNLMWAFYPVVGGIKTNQPEDGCSFVWMDGTTIRYWTTSDTALPTVSSVSPEDSATHVAVNTVVTATFSQAMDGSTITTESFTLAGSAISGTVTYDPATYTATFTPDADLEYDHQYTAILSTAITDVAGNPLAEPYSWSFTTEPSPIRVIRWEVTNLYETNLLREFVGRVIDLVGDTVWCYVDVYVTEDELIKDVRIKLHDGQLINLQKQDSGHYRAELRLRGALDPRDVLVRMLEVLCKVQGTGAVTVPIGRKEILDFSMVRIIIIDTDEQMHYVTESEEGQSLPERLPTFEDAMWDMLPGPWITDEGTFYGGFSPVGLLVADSDGRRVGALYEGGVFVGEVNEIPDALYWGQELDFQFAFIPDSSGGNTVTVAGIESGHYVLIVLSSKQGKADTFAALNIPTASGTVHKYTIDWDALSQGEAGITIEKDCDGDGQVDEIIITGIPKTPTGPSPVDDATQVSLDTILSWTGNGSDSVTYNVYFGTAGNPPLISGRQAQTTYVPALNSGTQYYWTVVAINEHSISSTGPVWSFSTEGFYQDEPSVEAGFESIAEELVIAYHYAGLGVWNVYWAEFGIDTIETLEMGKIYIIYVDSDCTLEYGTRSYELSGPDWNFIYWQGC